MSDKKKAASKKATAYGMVVIVLYTLLLTQQDFICSYCAQGHWHALLPIITAVIFSFAHGQFTGNFWSVLGIEASKKVQLIRKGK